MIPRNALERLPLHKVDVHVMNDVTLGGTRRVHLIAEVFNLFNHANCGRYNTLFEPEQRRHDRYSAREPRTSARDSRPPRRSSDSRCCSEPAPAPSRLALTASRAYSHKNVPSLICHDAIVIRQLERPLI